MTNRALNSAATPVGFPGLQIVSPSIPSSRNGHAGTLLGPLHGGLASAPRAGAVVTVSGEIDVATVETLRTTALSIARAAGSRPDQPAVVTVDLEAVTFMDSSVLRVLADLDAKGVEIGWTVEIIAPKLPGPAAFLRFAVEHGWVPADVTWRGGSQSVPPSG